MTRENSNEKKKIGKQLNFVATYIIRINQYHFGDFIGSK